MNSTEFQLNKAYAEGRHARFIGASLASNPWPAEFTEEYDAWQLGYAVGDSVADSTCYSGVTGLPAPTMSQLLTTRTTEKLIKMGMIQMGGSQPQPQPQPAATIPKPSGLYTWDIKIIRQLLKDQNIDFPPDANKAALIALLPPHPAMPDDTPSNQNTRVEIKAWLDKHGIVYPSDATKNNLLYIVHESVLLEHGLSLD